MTWAGWLIGRAVALALSLATTLATTPSTPPAPDPAPVVAVTDDASPLTPLTVPTADMMEP